jgi:peptidyl-prolyl cis-trans isomerase C
MGQTLINTLAERGGENHPMLEEAGCGGSCSTPAPAPARLAFDAPPVKVNGVELSEAEIAREVQHHEGASIEEARAAAARALTIRRLLLDRARGLGMSPAPEADALGRWESDEEALVRQVLEAEAPPTPPTAEECRRVFEARRAAFPPTFELAEPVIHDRLMARAWMAASARYVSQMMRSARIEGLNEIAPGGAP